MSKYDPTHCSGKRLAYLDRVHKKAEPAPAPSAPKKEVCLICWPSPHNAYPCRRYNRHYRTRGHRIARTPSLCAKAAARAEEALRLYLTSGRKGRNPYR